MLDKWTQYPEMHTRAASADQVLRGTADRVLQQGLRRARLAARLAIRQRVEGEGHTEVEVGLRVTHYVVVVRHLLPVSGCSARLPRRVQAFPRAWTVTVHAQAQQTTGRAIAHKVTLQTCLA